MSFWRCLLLWIWCWLCAGAQAQEILVPLDNRPSTLLFVQQIYRIGHPQRPLQVAPGHLLGRFHTPGDCQQLLDWLDSARPGQVAFVSSDMLLYGGLVASRSARTRPEQIQERLKHLEKVARGGVRLRVLAILPRLSLFTSPEHAAYERTLARWATDGGLPPARQLLEQPELFPANVPAQATREYLQVRLRNLQTLESLISMRASGQLEQLVIGQDDAHATGLHHHEQQRLRQLIRELNCQQTYLMSGADELMMNMVAGYLVERSGRTIGVNVFASGLDEIAVLESDPLRETLRGHLRLTGLSETQTEGAAVDLYLLTPTTSSIGDFLGAMRRAQENGRRLALADLAILNRMHPELGQALLEGALELTRLEGLAAWNTASNALGTTLAQLAVHRLAQESQGWTLKDKMESEKTHQAFLMARLVDDYLYQTLVREDVRPQEHGLSSEADPLLNLYGPLGLEIRLRLVAQAERLFQRQFWGKRVPLGVGGREASLEGMEMRVVLPWSRLFEVEVRLDLRLSQGGVARQAK